MVRPAVVPAEQKPCRQSQQLPFLRPLPSCFPCECNSVLPPVHSHSCADYEDEEDEEDDEE